MLAQVALAQAQLHSVPLDARAAASASAGASERRAFDFNFDFDFLPRVPFGMFAIRAQYEAQVVNGSGRWGSHPFIEFLVGSGRLATIDLCTTLAPHLPQAIIHSDLFLENIMFSAPSAAEAGAEIEPEASSSSSASSSCASSDASSSSSPRLVGLIDFEEMGVGPRLLDVAMSVVGCCYGGGGGGSGGSDSNRLDLPLARAFLHAYNALTPLTPLERQHFTSFLTWALLAIAYWRWQNFNVVRAEPNQRKEAYRAMQQRVEDLDHPKLRHAIADILDLAPSP